MWKINLSIPCQNSPPLPPAFGGMIKNVFADTTLVVAGTVLTLTVCLGCEEDSGPRTAARSMMAIIGMLTGGDGSGDSLKEL